MSFEQYGRHSQWIIKICEGTTGELLTGIKYSLGQFGYFFLLFLIRFRPGEIIVYNLFRITIVAFQTTSDASHPTIMHGRR